MAVDDGADVILFGNILYEGVDDETGLRIQTRVRFVAEQILRLQHDSAGDSDPFLLTAGDLARHEVPHFLWHLHASQAELRPFLHLLAALLRKHLHREEHILHDRHGVEQRRPLEQHSHLAVEHTDVVALHGCEVATVVEDLSAVQIMQTDHGLHENGLPRPRLTDDHVHFAVPHDGRNMVQHHVPLKTLYYIFYFNHNSNLLNTRSRKRIIILEWLTRVLHRAHRRGHYSRNNSPCW